MSERTEQAEIATATGVSRPAHKSPAALAFEGVVAPTQDAMIQAVTALSAAMESRCRWTSGHQGRVAQLAAALGHELGLSANLIDGLHLGALVHDIGKFAVPSQIVVKPGRLSEEETALVQQHSAAGYQILSCIRSPWPIADMAHQHHERLDGSGYPQGLKGEAIIHEARILAVADVIEAMLDARPYRPASPMVDVLHELQSNAGRLYDADAVKAAVDLITVRGFAFD